MGLEDKEDKFVIKSSVKWKPQMEAINVDSHIYDRERGRNLCQGLFMVVKIDILFALEFSDNYFLNACNCFKAVLPLPQGENL